MARKMETESDYRNSAGSAHTDRYLSYGGEVSVVSNFGWITTGSGRKIYRRLHRGYEVKRSGFSRPYIRADGMPDAVWNPCDGNYYDSRSQYERAVKASGAEIVGDDKAHWDSAAPKEYEPEGVKEDIKQAWDQLSS